MVLTVATGGVAALAYGVLWAALPVAGEKRSARRPAGRAGRGFTPAAVREGSPDRARKGRGRGAWMVGMGSGVAVLGLLFVFRESGVWWSDALVWPLVLAAGGAALAWRQFGGRDDTGPAESRPRFGPYRGGFGIALLLAAGLLFLYLSGTLKAGGQAALAGLTAVIVIGLVLAPFWIRQTARLGAERAERIRSQERAEMAAHLHDSVLQTLALIRRNPEDPRRISTLARTQERELREWINREDNGGEGRLAEALKTAAAEVEELHRVPIDTVTVGDRPLDDAGRALVGAAREAMANAARHGAGHEPGAVVRLYAEIEPGRAQVFVHDRGPGFDPDRVPADRQGIRNSIIGRMERHGGRVEIRSAPGEGTEVELTMEAP